MSHLRRLSFYAPFFFRDFRIALMTSLMILTLISFFACIARAENGDRRQQEADGRFLPGREISIEWEANTAAAFYDIEITRKPTAGAKPQTESTTEAKWVGKLVPGYYQMRVRGKDRRRVPGDWSEATDLTVLLERPTSKTLTKELRLDSTDPEEFEYEFAWEPVAGAQSYSLKLQAATGQTLQTLESKEPSLKAKLRVGQATKWVLIGQNSEGLISESPLLGQIDVWGPELAKAEMSAPENKFVRELTWKRPPFSEDVSYALQAYDPKSKKWNQVDSQKNFTPEKIDFGKALPGGRYRISLRSQAPLRKESKVTTLAFFVQDGDRSEEAEYSAMLRQSIVRTTGWYVIASYLITAMNYEGVNADNGGSAPLKVQLPSNLGGTGRLGVGYLSGRRPWGFLGVADYSGFQVAGMTPTFATLEANAIHRLVVGKTGEFRQHMGVFYKEVPEIIARDLTGVDRIDKIVGAGPHYGFEYWWAMTPKIGLQANGHLYASLVSVKTPTGNPAVTSLSYQMGLMGSYRLSQRASGLIGYAYRKDSQAYQSSSEKSNTVDITGHYLNLFLEWAL